MKHQLLALATFSGTTIGVGLFGLPYVTAQIGFMPIIFYFIVLGALMIIMNLMYAEIASRTPATHRLPGYCNLYLGRFASGIEHVSSSLGLTGALLAYIIIGSQFLHSLLSPMFGGPLGVYVAIFFGTAALVVYFGSGAVSKTELGSLVVFFVILLLLFLKAAPHFTFDYFTTVDWTHAFLPYGVILFAIGGTSIIPEMREILREQNESKLLWLVVWGTILPIVTYIFFIITVLGVTGTNTTEEALIGLNQVIGNGTVVLGFLFGIITTFTSFLTLAITLKKQLQLDLHLPKFSSWALAVFPALLLYLLGLTDFITLIGFIGAGLLGIDISMIILTYIKAKKHGKRRPAFSLAITPIWAIMLLIFFLAGVALEIAKVIHV